MLYAFVVLFAMDEACEFISFLPTEPHHGRWMRQGFYVPFITISVMSGRWKGEHKMLCAIKCRLRGSEKISPPRLRAT